MSTTVANKVSVGVNSKSTNILGGTQLEFMQYNANLILGFLGPNDGENFVTVHVGDELVIDDQMIAVGTALPQKDDINLNTGARRGDRVSITFRAVGNASANDIYYFVKAVPAA